MTSKYLSKFAKDIHEAATDSYKAGVMHKTTMREFDELCLIRVGDLKPADIQSIRTKANVSQAVLARHLNVSTGLVSQWERGERKPSGPALALLSLIKRKGLAVLTEQEFAK